MAESNLFHDAWKKKEHAQLFDAWSHVPLFVLKDRFKRCNEIKLLHEVLGGKPQLSSLLEIGCATGEFYRYFASCFPKFSYAGCDISIPAISRAQEKFPNGPRFIQTDESLNNMMNCQADVVFCRDVILHQPEPLSFLRKLYDLAERFVILRLRTRDNGSTEWDPQKSCQLNYGVWAPYIVLNTADLYEFIQKFSPKPKRIHLLKHFMILGGQHSRYLPKDCYMKETGTAETALLIEKGNQGGACSVVEEAVPENFVLGFLPRITGAIFRRWYSQPRT